MENFQVQLLGPPISIAARAAGNSLFVYTAREWALGIIGHDHLLLFAR